MRVTILPSRYAACLEESVQREKRMIERGLEPVAETPETQGRECAVIVLPDITDVPLFTLVKELTRALATAKAAPNSNKRSTAA